jgi:heat shock protein HslJ
VPLIKGYRITLEIAAESVTGKSACNTYGGRMDTSGDSVSLDGLGGTEMGCARPVMHSEETYLNTLLVADTIEREGDTLTLTGPDAELVFELVTPPPVAELTDTVWQLESLLEGSGNEASGSSTAAPAELILRSDGTLSATTGCQELEGEWSQRADEIVLPLLSSRNRCGPDISPELRQQDIHVSGVLGDGFTFDLEGQTLTVFSVGGRGLQYTAKSGS